MGKQEVVLYNEPGNSAGLNSPGIKEVSNRSLRFYNHPPGPPPWLRRGEKVRKDTQAKAEQCSTPTFWNWNLKFSSLPDFFSGQEKTGGRGQSLGDICAGDTLRHFDKLSAGCLRVTFWKCGSYRISYKIPGILAT